MTIGVPEVLVYFGLEYSPGTNHAIYDHATRGVYDSPTYVYVDSSGEGVAVTSDVYDIRVNRGRSRELDEFQPGTATVRLRNFDRAYDGLNAAGIYYGDLTPGKRITIGIYGQTIFDGTIEDWDVDWTVDGDASATITAVDPLGQLGMKEFDAWVTTDGQTAGQRITDILNRPEVAFSAMRDIDTGTTLLQDDVVSWGSKVLPYAQKVVETEGGWLFASRDGKITMRDRMRLVSPAVQARFADDGTGIKLRDVKTACGSDFLFNKVGVDRVGGTLQTATGDTSRGVRPLNRTGMLMQTDAEALSRAQYDLSIYNDPPTRISKITVNVSSLTDAEQAAVAALDMTSAVEVEWTPGRVGASVEQLLVIEGITHTLGHGRPHYVDISLSPVFQQAVAFYDDPVRGVYDSTNYVYAF